MTKKKTRQEKIKSSYRLQNFRLETSEREETRDRNEFGYLSRDFVVKDLLKTAVYTVLILAILVLAKLRLG